MILFPSAASSNFARQLPLDLLSTCRNANASARMQVHQRYRRARTTARANRRRLMMRTSPSMKLGRRCSWPVFSVLFLLPPWASARCPHPDCLVSAGCQNLMPLIYTRLTYSRYCSHFRGVIRQLRAASSGNLRGHRMGKGSLSGYTALTNVSATFLAPSRFCHNTLSDLLP